jgi:transcriptional regulator of acetoin/glycerol metabolism
MIVSETGVADNFCLKRPDRCLGGPEGAAARLGLKRTTLFHKMRRLGIARPARRAVGASFR